MTPSANRQAHAVLFRTYKQTHKTSIPVIVVLAGLAIMTPLARAQRCGYETANLAFDPPSIDSTVLTSDPVDGPTPGQKSIVASDSTGESNEPPLVVRRREWKPDFNKAVFFRHKLEFSLDVGWLPINVPFPFDVFEGDPYDLYPCATQPRSGAGITAMATG